MALKIVGRGFGHEVRQLENMRTSGGGQEHAGTIEEPRCPEPGRGITL
ncbi:MAG: hypothetical protein HPM95_06740 [Alphaproteobacteria bacterium]|nr:hypothetical protein [Alphaproteobacteria bacterium]